MRGSTREELEMAAAVRAPKDKKKFTFKTVQLLKNECLGVGSYGAVYKAKCDDLVCAAKVIHPTLFGGSVALQQIPPGRKHRLPIRRFEQECEFMSRIRHPNIVQCLGTSWDKDDMQLPILLMELMDMSLTHFLETSQQPIHYHIQINMCHDVSLALSFLHSNNIVHRDLSSNNVLLRGDAVACKVTDFGMARLEDINPQSSRFSNTMCPGTDVYMSPESVRDKPVYTEKLDCFSFGVITLQILTRLFPMPSSRTKEEKSNHPGSSTGTVFVPVREVDRRQNHISIVAVDHPLRPVVVDCLRDKDSERPSAHELCERVGELKRTEKYMESTRNVQRKDSKVQAHDQKQVTSMNMRFSKVFAEIVRLLRKGMSAAMDFDLIVSVILILVVGLYLYIVILLLVSTHSHVGINRLLNSQI